MPKLPNRTPSASVQSDDPVHASNASIFGFCGFAAGRRQQQIDPAVARVIVVGGEIKRQLLCGGCKPMRTSTL